MKFLLLFTIVSLWFYLSINAAQTHKNGELEYFFSYPMQKNWYQAMRFCGSSDKQLLSIDSREENDFIACVIRDTLDYFRDSSSFWTSGNDLGEQRQFHWATHGNSMTFTDWAPKQPNHHGQEDCIELSGTSGFKWNDAKCNKLNYFICEPKTCRNYTVANAI